MAVNKKYVLDPQGLQNLVGKITEPDAYVATVTFNPDGGFLGAFSLDFKRGDRAISAKMFFDHIKTSFLYFDLDPNDMPSNMTLNDNLTSKSILELNGHLCRCIRETYAGDDNPDFPGATLCTFARSVPNENNQDVLVSLVWTPGENADQGSFLLWPDSLDGEARTVLTYDTATRYAELTLPRMTGGLVLNNTNYVQPINRPTTYRKSFIQAIDQARGIYVPTSGQSHGDDGIVDDIDFMGHIENAVVAFTKRLGANPSQIIDMDNAIILRLINKTKVKDFSGINPESWNDEITAAAALYQDMLTDFNITDIIGIVGSRSDQFTIYEFASPAVANATSGRSSSAFLLASDEPASDDMYDEDGETVLVQKGHYYMQWFAVQIAQDKPIEDNYNRAEIGDVVARNAAGEKVIVRKADILSMDTTELTPIGVVAIPSIHNVYGNGDAMAISLISNGTSTAHGNAELDFSELKAGLKGIAAYNVPSQVLYPTRSDGEKNPAYFEEGQAYSDFDGYSNTYKICNMVFPEMWKSFTDEEVALYDDKLGYDFLKAFSELSYIPSLGEVGYIQAYFNELSKTVGTLRDLYGSDTTLDFPIDGDPLLTSSRVLGDPLSAVLFKIVLSQTTVGIVEPISTDDGADVWRVFRV